MPIHVKSGGAWRDVSPYIKVSGTWHPVMKAHPKTGGVWEETYAAATLSDVTYTHVAINQNATSGIRVSSDGYIYEITETGAVGETYTQDYQWLTAPALSSSDFEVRLVTGSGSIDEGASADTWYSLSSTRNWKVVDTLGNGSSVTFTGTLQLRSATSNTIVFSCSVSISATRNNI